MAPGVADSASGSPTCRITPQAGCSSSTVMPRAAASGDANASTMSLIGPAGTSAASRVVSQAALEARLATRFREQPSAAWLTTLDAAEVPAGPINDIVEAFASPEAAALGMTVELEHPAWGVIRQVGLPLTLSATPGAIRRPPPTLGQETEEILAGLGYEPAEIEAFRARGVV